MTPAVAVLKRDLSGTSLTSYSRSLGGVGSARKALTKESQLGGLHGAADSRKGSPVAGRILCPMGQDWRALLRTAIYIREDEQSSSPQEHCYGKLETDRLLGS
ncbi:hypothetical protein P7K49_014029 [Saguinus oedipus]|uniref:Uncharacterized protein n=1 Tax=Saguinus oedipus TaxID=9490 RepID=A0ABQ9VJ24_SAGOE|nr:hypothetical protein P7K49_014029 [Saguinus oedipus]